MIFEFSWIIHINSLNKDKLHITEFILLISWKFNLIFLNILINNVTILLNTENYKEPINYVRNVHDLDNDLENGSKSNLNMTMKLLNEHIVIHIGWQY